MQLSLSDRVLEIGHRKTVVVTQTFDAVFQCPLEPASAGHQNGRSSDRVRVAGPETRYLTFFIEI